MAEQLADVFVACSARRLRQMLARIEACLGKLTEEQIWARGSENENAIGNLLLHLRGNVRQWIVSGVGSVVDDRKRDEEFAARGVTTSQQMLERLKATVDEALGIVEGLTEARLTERIHVQGYDITVLEAVYHVVEHFGQHTAQIIFATKMMTQADMGFYRHLTGPRHGEKTP